MRWQMAAKGSLLTHAAASGAGAEGWDEAGGEETWCSRDMIAEIRDNATQDIWRVNEGLAKEIERRDQVECTC